MVDDLHMSVPTVAGLCVRLGVQLAPAPGFEAPRTPISAVHISELVDPTAYLSGGELLLTTGLALPRSTLGCQRYVRRLVDAGLSALALGLGPVHRDLPEPLVRACSDEGLCLLVVPTETPFLAITKAYWSDLGRSAERQLVDVLATHQRLVDAAATADAQSAVLRTLVRSVGEWGAVLDRDGEVEEVWPRRAARLAGSLRGELGRMLAAGTSSAASLRMGDAHVSVYPLSVEGHLEGYFALGSAAPPTGGDRRLLLTACALLSTDLVRRRAERLGTGAALRAVCLLLDLGLPDAAVRLAARLDAPPLGARVRLLALSSSVVADAADAVRRWCADAMECPVDDSRSWFVLPPDHPPYADLEALLERRAPDCRSALSAEIGLDDVGRVRARLVRSLDAPSPAASAPPSSSVLEERLGNLLREPRGDLGRSLVSYLRHRGQWEPAARELGVHRNTLRARLERCRALLDADVNAPDVAADLWQLMRLRGLTDPAAVRIR